LTVSDPGLRARLAVAKMNIVLSSSVLDEALAERILARREGVLAPRRANLDQALEILGDWHAAQKVRLDWVRPEGGAMRLRSDQVDDSSVSRFWERLTDNDIQLGAGPWFGESTRVFRLGFGYLPLPDFRIALDRLAATMDQATERPLRLRADGSRGS
jgi:DNA-binding transcriptional MocR family regulator